MRIPMLILFAALLMPGCSSDRTAGRDQATSAFQTDRPDVIEVAVSDQQAVSQAELIAPDGKRFPAFQISRDTASNQKAKPSFGVGVGVGGNTGGNVGVGTGVGIGIPLTIGGDAARQRVRSVALIKVDDMAAYRAGWQDWTLRITFAGNDEAAPRQTTLAAPKPPAS